MFRKRKKPDYQHIAALERDLGLDDDLAPKKRVLPRPVVLSPITSPVDVLSFRPGFKWPVSDHDDIRPLVSATAGRAEWMYEPKKSKVVLPAGVSV